jgi:uncharacterized protein (DUF433 family)
MVEVGEMGVKLWYHPDMDTNVISVKPDVQGGVPCFAGTRVPIVSLIDHLEQGYSVDEFLADFPTVKREQAISLHRHLAASLAGRLPHLH